MTERLKQIIAAKTGGSQRQFCEIMGWSPQYLNNILTKGRMGLTPVEKIIRKFRDIDPRWLITGEGNMYGQDVDQTVTAQYHNKVDTVIALSRFIPIMTEEEQKRLAKYIALGIEPHFTAFEYASLEERIRNREDSNSIVEQAMKESVCSHPKA